MLRIVLAMVAVSALIAGVYVKYPVETKRSVEWVSEAGEWTWENVRANPVPVGLALGTFLLTVIYHKAKGKSLRESVEVAATRVAVIPVAVADAEDEHPVVKRARARATRAQLLADQVGLQNRQRKLPEEVAKAVKEACDAGQALADAERKLADKQKHHDAVVARLEALRAEKERADTELAVIAGELEKLNDVV
jgi:hypothetical protein